MHEDFFTRESLLHEGSFLNKNKKFKEKNIK